MLFMKVSREQGIRHIVRNSSTILHLKFLEKVGFSVKEGLAKLVLGFQSMLPIVTPSSAFRFTLTCIDAVVFSLDEFVCNAAVF